MTRWQRLGVWANHRAKALMPWLGAGYVEASSLALSGRGFIGWRELQLVATSSLLTYFKSNGRKPRVIDRAREQSPRP